MAAKNPHGEIMIMKSSWFIITSEEIETIQSGLSQVGNTSPGNENRVREMLDVIDTVRERLA